MKIAYKHLLRFIKDKPEIKELSDKLFQLGHEHEINDFIFDMEFTPNRGDCLSLMGLIRDLNVFYKTDTDIPIYTIWGESDEVVPYETFKDKIKIIFPRRNEFFIKDTGHLPHMENPEQFNKVLLEILEN